MYKEIIITIIIIVVIFGLDILTNNYTSNAADVISIKLDELKQEVEKENTEDIANKTSEILNKWKEYYNILAYYIEHDELEKVDTELTKLKADQEVQKYDDCINEIETTKFILNHIKDKEKFTIQSIF